MTIILSYVGFSHKHFFDSIDKILCYRNDLN